MTAIVTTRGKSKDVPMTCFSIRLPSSLVRQLKARAIRTDTTMQHLLASLLEKELNRGPLRVVR